MPLGTQVGLGPGDIVLDGEPAPHGKGTVAPPPLIGPGLLRPMSIVAKAKRSPISATAALLFSLCLKAFIHSLLSLRCAVWWQTDSSATVGSSLYGLTSCIRISRCFQLMQTETVDVPAHFPLEYRAPVYIERSNAMDALFPRGQRSLK